MPELDPKTARRPLHSVLIATDFTDNARQALLRAATLPLQEGASLTIVHVLPAGLSQALDAQLDEAARRALDAAVQVVAGAAPPGLRVTTSVERGAPVTEILRRVEQDAVELLVFGRHGSRGFRELLIGSTAERLIRRSGCPILVVSAAPAGPYRRVLAALDAQGTALLAFELALRLVDRRVEVIEAVHACDEDALTHLVEAGTPEEVIARCRVEQRRHAEQATHGFLQRLSHAGAAWKLELLGGDPRRVVLDEATRRGVDLIVLGTHRPEARDHGGLGRVAEAVARSARCDVLVARPRAPASLRPTRVGTA
jgi:nucleotide-binding universal stress UspA family protein